MIERKVPVTEKLDQDFHTSFLWPKYSLCDLFKLKKINFHWLWCIVGGGWWNMGGSTELPPGGIMAGWTGTHLWNGLLTPMYMAVWIMATKYTVKYGWN